MPGSEAILSLVSLGCGVGIVPRIVMDKSPLRAKVRALDVEARRSASSASASARSAASCSSPLVRALWDSFRATPARAAAALTSR